MRIDVATASVTIHSAEYVLHGQSSSTLVDLVIPLVITTLGLTEVCRDASLCGHLIVGMKIPVDWSKALVLCDPVIEWARRTANVGLCLEGLWSFNIPPSSIARLDKLRDVNPDAISNLGAWGRPKVNAAKLNAPRMIHGSWYGHERWMVGSNGPHGFAHSLHNWLRTTLCSNKVVSHVSSQAGRASGKLSLRGRSRLLLIRRLVNLHRQRR